MPPKPLPSSQSTHFLSFYHISLPSFSQFSPQLNLPKDADFRLKQPVLRCQALKPLIIKLRSPWLTVSWQLVEALQVLTLANLIIFCVFCCSLQRLIRKDPYGGKGERSRIISVSMPRKILDFFTIRGRRGSLLVVQYNNNAKLSIISHEPLIDDYQHLRPSLYDKVRHILTRSHVFDAQLDGLEVVALEPLPDFDGRAEVAFGEDEVFYAIVGLFEHLLMMGLALDGIPGAYLLGHRGEDSIMVAKQAATHDVVVFADKLDVFHLLEALPVPMPRFYALFYLPLQPLYFFWLWPVAELPQCDLGLHAFLALLGVSLLLQTKIKEIRFKMIHRQNEGLRPWFWGGG